MKAERNPWKRLVVEKIALWIIRIAVILFAAIFLSILIAVFVKGLPGLSFDLIFRLPQGGFYLGREGGILNAIIGSLVLGVSATVIALIVSLPLVLFINVYLSGKSRIAALVRFALDILWGIPSIVYGACGITIMLAIGLKYSLLAGIVVVALMEIPILARSIDEVTAMVPRELFQVGYSLGGTSRQVSFRITVRAIVPGIITGTLLAFGRGIGDAAAVMLVAGFQDGIPQSFSEPVATLPLAVYYLVNSPLPEVRARGYAAGIVLILIILAVSIFARILGRRFSKYKNSNEGIS